MHSAPPPDDRVLIRTLLGQHAAFDDIELDAVQCRLLRLVNGYTPLGELEKVLRPTMDWSAVAAQLTDRGLVIDVAKRTGADGT
jgi:hypothetical protein